jgi:hypothetical protein
LPPLKLLSLMMNIPIHVKGRQPMEKLKSEVVGWLHSKRRIINMMIGLSALVLCEVARAYYRPFIYSNGINDFHIADTLGNTFGTVAAVFVFASLLGHNHDQEHFLIFTVSISVLVYELAHPLLGKSVDPWDLVATVIAGFFCEGIHRLVHGQQPSTPTGLSC